MSIKPEARSICANQGALRQQTWYCDHRKDYQYATCHALLWHCHPISPVRLVLRLP